jgi:hypothetical protein
MPEQNVLLYVDLRMFKYFFTIQMELFSKQIGILLQHKKDPKILYEIWTKKNHEEDFQRHFVEPVYPVEEVPPLLELLNRQDHPKHDETRFKLLKWLVDDEKLKNEDLSLIPRKYFLDILVLVCLRRHKFIAVQEADLILLTIKNAELGFLPSNLQPPPVLNKRAFQASFLFLKFYSFLQRSLEVVGLEDSLSVG